MIQILNIDDFKTIDELSKALLASDTSLIVIGETSVVVNAGGDALDWLAQKIATKAVSVVDQGYRLERG